MSENVMVINKDLLIPYLHDEDVSLMRNDKDKIFDLILRNHFFIERQLAEVSVDLKQIIPYVVIRYVDNYLVLQRTEKQTERRLHNKYSLGIGGHINPDNSKRHENVIINGLYKELDEEVTLENTLLLEFIGVLNDETNEVSKVHLGLIYFLEVGSSHFGLPEIEKMTGYWISKSELLNYYSQFESWSQIIYKRIISN